MEEHHHDQIAGLPQEARAILQRGLAELLQITNGLGFRPVVSE